MALHSAGNCAAWLGLQALDWPALKIARTWPGFCCMEMGLQILQSHYMNKAELLITPTPSGDPLLRGCCSACPNIRFAFVGNTEENRRCNKRRI